MSESKKIVLPIVTKDSNGNDYVKEVHYDCAFLQGKNIRDWDENGRVVKDRCVIFATLKFTKDGDFTVIAMSRKDLVKKLEDAGLISVVSLV